MKIYLLDINYRKTKTEADESRSKVNTCCGHIEEIT